MRHVLLGIGVCLLAGCSVGIKDGDVGSLKAQFSAPVTYQEAYRRAGAYARHCRTSTNILRESFDVGGDLFTDTEKGVVRISAPGTGKDLERIDIAKDGDGASVTVTAWGTGIWDEREMEAAKQSIVTGTPTCRM